MDDDYEATVKEKYNQVRAIRGTHRNPNVTVLKKIFALSLEALERENDSLVKISKNVKPKFECSGSRKQLEGKHAILFEKVNGSEENA